MTTRKTSVRVMIVGEEYTIRSDAPPEHTRAVAEQLDAAIRRVLSGGSVVEAHRAAILAALQITGELMETKETLRDLNDGMQKLSAELVPLLPPAKRPSGPVER
jgi:cell division protein ZapA